MRAPFLAFALISTHRCDASPESLPCREIAEQPFLKAAAPRSRPLEIAGHIDRCIACLMRGASRFFCAGGTAILARRTPLKRCESHLPCLSKPSRWGCHRLSTGLGVLTLLRRDGLPVTWLLKNAFARVDPGARNPGEQTRQVHAVPGFVLWLGAGSRAFENQGCRRKPDKTWLQP
jgi:hypothetical protein